MVFLKCNKCSLSENERLLLKKKKSLIPYFWIIVSTMNFIAWVINNGKYLVYCYFRKYMLYTLFDLMFCNICLLVFFCTVCCVLWIVFKNPLEKTPLSHPYKMPQKIWSETEHITETLFSSLLLVPIILVYSKFNVISWNCIEYIEIHSCCWIKLLLFFYYAIQNIKLIWL